MSFAAYRIMEDRFGNFGGQSLSYEVLRRGVEALGIEVRDRSRNYRGGLGQPCG